MFAEKNTAVNKYVGALDVSQYPLVQGWVWIPECPHIKVGIDILQDNRIVRSGFAAAHREDLQEQGIGDGCHGFSFVLDGLSEPGKETVISVRVAHTDIEVASNILAAVPSKQPAAKITQSTVKISGAAVSGEVTGLMNGALEGWAVNSTNPDTPAKVDIHDNGKLLATVTANLLHVAAQKAGFGKGYHGFSYQLPRSLYDKEQHTLEVFISGTPTRLSGANIVFDGHPKYEGFLEGADNFTLKGWAREVTDTGQTVSLDVYADGVCLETINADMFREDLLQSKPGNGFYGFLWKLPTHLYDHNEHMIEVRIAGTPINLRRSPVVLAPKRETTGQDNAAPEYEGNFERVKGDIVFGWAWNSRNPHEALCVDLYIDNAFITANKAQNFRLDVQRLGKGTGKYGFNFEIPERFFDGREHKLDVKISGTDISLKTSPKQLLLGAAAVPHVAGDARGGNVEEFYTVPETLLYVPPARKMKKTAAKQPKISIIILSRNGAHLLENLFRSFMVHNTYPNYEFIVVDHASEDNSLGMLEAWKERLPLHIMACDTNYSFSYSNNRAVEIAKGDYVLFMNNDIILHQDVLGEMAAVLEDPDVGLVGVKLLDITFHNGKAIYPPVQHLGVQFGVDRLSQKLEPHDVHLMKETAGIASRMVQMPAATAAVLMARKEEFSAVGGFHESYFYGYEDVDLGLKYSACKGMKIIVANHLSLLHHRGYSRFNVDQAFNQRSSVNGRVLSERFGYRIRQDFMQSLFAADRKYTEKTLNVAFAVSEASMDAAAADYFTAWELGEELRKQYGWNIFYLAKDRDWFDLTDMDVLVVMRDDYNLTQIKNAKPNLMKIGWARNWFERWGERPWFHRYDVCLCSSQAAVDYMREKHTVRTGLLRIAGSPERFKPSGPVAGFESDYCFTGSFFKHKRDIIDALQPERLPYNFALYGHDWEQFTKFRNYYRGGVPYSDMPKVYASTKILIDDANHVTKEWGSTNSRVFDALCSGVMVITNSEASSREVFNGRLPFYRTREELETLITYYLEHEEERVALAQELHKIALEKHSYSVRAQEFHSHIKPFMIGHYRIAIKIGAPNWEKVHEWGDYHYALAMKRSFERYGHFVRIDVVAEWDTPHTAFDDVVVVLRGLSTYTPKPGQINLMWNISHVDAVSDREYETYDHVFVASIPYAKQLAKRVSVPVSPLLQCADPSVFFPLSDEDRQAHDVLFVGNSRKVYRKIMRDAVTAGVKVDVYGSNWETYLPSGYLQGEYIDNRELRCHYAGAKILLNDHWDNMAKHSLLSNRLFDAGACGAFVITDEVDGLSNVFGDSVVSYKDADDLKQKVAYYLKHEKERNAKAQNLHELVCKEHTFDNRVDTLLKTIHALHTQHMEGKALLC